VKDVAWSLCISIDADVAPLPQGESMEATVRQARIGNHATEREIAIPEEDWVSAKDLAEYLGCSASKIYKIIRVGAKAIDGRFVTLETVLTEGGKRTSIDAYRRFQVRLNQTLEEEINGCR